MCCCSCSLAVSGRPPVGLAADSWLSVRLSHSRNSSNSPWKPSAWHRNHAGERQWANWSDTCTTILKRTILAAQQPCKLHPFYWIDFNVIHCKWRISGYKHMQMHLFFIGAFNQISLYNDAMVISREHLLQGSFQKLLPLISLQQKVLPAAVELIQLVSQVVDFVSRTGLQQLRACAVHRLHCSPMGQHVVS